MKLMSSKALKNFFQFFLNINRSEIIFVNLKEPVLTGTSFIPMQPKVILVSGFIL